MDKIKKYYDILGVKSNTPFKKIRRRYTSLALRYHPKSSAYYFNNEKFVDIVVAFDLVSKIANFKQEYGYKTKNEIYENWLQHEKQLAQEKAKGYIKLKREDFERIFFPGLNITKRLVYSIFMILTSIGLLVPIIAYIEGELSTFGIIYITSYTFFLLKLIFDTIIRERKSRQLVKSIHKRNVC